MITISQKDRRIRVFVSSTFRDMQEERDHLSKIVFPQLRRLCESRGVIWAEVDLRWGITNEQRAEGKVLPLCFEEIQRCRPYFIALLGERYGWVSDRIPQELISREAWLAQSLDRSITELEILHAVLQNPEAAEHAVFYFRDPAYFNQVPVASKPDFCSEDNASAEKLRKLKDRIRRSGFPVRENYPNPQALGELVLHDLSEVINRLFPEDSQPSALEREAHEHLMFAMSRSRTYIDRPGVRERLDANLHTPGPPLVVYGDSGCGKSTALANWSIRRLGLQSDALILMHFVGATPDSVSLTSMLKRLMGQLKQHCHINGMIPEHPYALQEAFRTWLRSASGERTIVLILDGIDRLDESHSAHTFSWLPDECPTNVRIILSTSTGPTLSELQRRHWPMFWLEPLSIDERRNFIREYLSKYAKALGPEHSERIATASSAKNPLFLQILLEELRLHGDHSSLEQRIDDCLAATTLRDLHECVLTRYEKDYERERPGLIRDIMGLLWAARRGLSEAEILDLVGSDERPLPRAYFSPILFAAERSVFDVTAFVRLSGDAAREAIQRRYLPSEEDQRKARLRLADYFEKQPVGIRKADELPWQLLHAGSWERLVNVLANLDFLSHMIKDNIKRDELVSYWAAVGSRADPVSTYRYSLKDHKQRGLSQREVARLVRLIAVLLYHLTRYDDLEQLIMSELPGFEAVLSGDVELANLTCIIAAKRQTDGDLASAERLWTQGLLMLKEASASVPTILKTESMLAKVHVAQGRFSEAEGHFRNILLLEPALADIPQSLAFLDTAVVKDLIDLIVVAQMGFADARAAQGDYQEAEEFYGHAIAVLEKDTGQSNDLLIAARQALDEVYKRQGKLRQSVDVAGQYLFGAGPKYVLNRNELDAVRRLAARYYSEKKYAEAEILLKKVLAQAETALGTAHPWTAEVLCCISEVCAEQGKYKDALAFRERALCVDERSFGSDDTRVPVSLMSLGGLYCKMGSYERAEDCLLRALEIRRRIAKPNDPDLFRSVMALGLFYKERGRYSEATSLLEEADGKSEAAKLEVPDTLKALLEVIEREVHLGNWDKVEDLLPRAFEHGRRLSPDHPGLSNYFVRLARCKSRLSACRSVQTKERPRPRKKWWAFRR